MTVLYVQKCRFRIQEYYVIMTMFVTICRERSDMVLVYVDYIWKFNDLFKTKKQTTLKCWKINVISG